MWLNPGAEERTLRILCHLQLLLGVALCGADAAADPMTVVTLGDSITKGVRPGVEAKETFTSLAEQQLQSKGLSVRIINQGVGGETTAGGLVRLERDVLSLKPAYVVVMYGTNDCYVDAGKSESRLSVAEYRTNLEQLIERIQASGAAVILMTEPCYARVSPANGAGEHGNKRLATYMEECRKVARGKNIPLVDNFELWKTALDQGESIESWTTDGYHPNPQGHRKIADILVTVLAEAMKKKVPATAP